MKIIERRAVAFFHRQLEIMPKNDFTAAYLAGELMAWGLARAITEDTELELELLLDNWKNEGMLNEVAG